MSEPKEQDNKPPEDNGAERTRSFDGTVMGPGSQIGPFRIEHEIGRGGAGVVYLARDTELERPVAIKSLPTEMMENPKARMRFAREARVLASLNHPNIATIYEEIQEAEGVAYLVLEYVPGETLAEQIAHARLKLQEALPIALQIADAVASAHEHEVIHRDLKPANIKITPEGRIKVLDFGLARALGGETVDPQVSITEPGRVIGTPAYMSPEQARGMETDKRCDIWAFGCVLYELLTGRVPFEGDTVSDTLAGILDREPDWDALPQATPANIRVLLRRCLEKDPHRRLHDIADAGIEIRETLSGSLEVFALPGKVAPASRLFRRDLIFAALVCLIAGALTAGVFLWHSHPKPVVSRTQILLPTEMPLYTGLAPNSYLAISPDGTRLVYVRRFEDRSTELCMRSLDSLEITPIPGTRNAHNPFFSFDGRWVGFFTEEKQLKKFSLPGGPAVPLVDDIQLGDIAFGSSGDDGYIVFSVASGGGGLQRISQYGGQAETLVTPVPGADRDCYCYPQVLPGSNAILYSHVYLENSRRSCIEAFSRETGKQQVVLPDASYATYVSSGHLIFVRDGVLMAAPFDVERLRTGPPVPLGDDDVGFDYTGKTPQLAISNNGSIVYVPASEELRKTELVWVDPNGVPNSLGADADVYEGPRVSPDGQLIAVAIRLREEHNIRVHIYNVKDRTFYPLMNEGESSYPQWAPDAERIAFWGRDPRTGEKGLFCKSLGGPPAVLASGPSTGIFLHPCSWSKNLLTGTVRDPNTLEGIWIMDLDGDRQPKRFLSTEHKEYNPTFSLDGRWLAYVVEKSEQLSDLYVQQYPAGQPWRVATGRVRNPVWSRDGRKLYYICDKKMMAVPVTSEPGFPTGKPVLQFELPYAILPGDSLMTNYDICDDGQFLMLKMSDDAKDELIYVTNWFEKLKRPTPARIR